MPLGLDSPRESASAATYGAKVNLTSKKYIRNGPMKPLGLSGAVSLTPLQPTMVIFIPTLAPGCTPPINCATHGRSSTLRLATPSTFDPPTNMKYILPPGLVSSPTTRQPLLVFNQHMASQSTSQKPQMPGAYLGTLPLLPQSNLRCSLLPLTPTLTNSPNTLQLFSLILTVLSRRI
jgi:hypothetical protein